MKLAETKRPMASPQRAVLLWGGSDPDRLQPTRGIKGSTAYNVQA
jgi:hypothetical protein